MNKPKDRPTYEDEVLSVLAYEFSICDRAESEKKIKRHLRDKKLGVYDQSRIDALRALKEDVRKELNKGTRSQFFVGAHGKYSDPQDWHFDNLLEHMRNAHTEIPVLVIGRFLPFAIYIYYLR